MKQLPRNRSLSHADTVYETDHVSEGSCFFMIANKEHLAIMKTLNADNPLAHDLEAVLTIDVWEHAYYLDYQNRRGDFIEAFLEHLVDWKE